MGGKPTKSCPVCGRRIVVGHNLSQRNYDAHMTACPRQREEERTRKWRKMLHAAGHSIGSQVQPGAGQFGFPFDGVPAEVLR